MMQQDPKENLFKALGLFIEVMRPYVVSVLTQIMGEKWPAAYFESLNPQQKDNWNYALKSGSAAESLIDFHNLKSFSIKYRDLIKTDFGKNVTKLPTWFEEIAEVRHKCTHYQDLDELDFRRAYDNMILISKAMQMSELVKELESLQSGVSKKKAGAKNGNVGKALLPWFRIVQPHLDIRSGNLDESVFAANLAEVALGTAREIYSNPALFFAKSFFTLGMKTVAKKVIAGLNGGTESENRVITLQTGFGGGKTHTLISLYHLGKMGKEASKSSELTELISATGKPNFNKANIAVFTNRTTDAAQGRITEDGIHIRTLWGELAYQLAGKKGFEIVRENDEQCIAPAGLFQKVLSLASPALILIDELADYCVKAAGKQVGATNLSDQTISFMQELTESVSLSDKCVLVSTLPASPQEVASSPHAQQILNSLQNRMGRISADTKPVADEEIFEVIRRRLFEDLGDDEIRNRTIAAYYEMYKAAKQELPDQASRAAYKEKLIKSFPFHPELIDMFRVRWASNHDFQRTRGVLRLLASIVSDLWKRKENLAGSNLLIHTSDVNFANLDALSGKLKELFGNGFDAVITADVSGSSSNAFKIDSDKQDFGIWSLAQGIASTILLGSFGSEGANKGMSIADLKLCVLRPGGFSKNDVHVVLDDLEAKAHFLYYNSSVEKRYWFHVKPNINILIGQAENDIKTQDIEGEILKRLNERRSNVMGFNVLVDPREDVPEQMKPAIVILHPKFSLGHGPVPAVIKTAVDKIASKRGNTERIYRNTILFLVCSEIGLGQLQANLRAFLACQRILIEYQGQMDDDQKREIRRRMDEATKSAGSSLVSAYHIVLKHSAKKGIEKLEIRQFKDSLDAQINLNVTAALKTEEWMLDGIGFQLLIDLKLLPGPEKAMRVKDVYEAFLRFDDKPMISGIDAVQSSLLRYCNTGQLAIAAGDGKTFSAFYFKNQIPFFDVTDENYWLVDKVAVPISPPPPGTETIVPPVPPTPPTTTEDPETPPLRPQPQPETQGKRFKSLTISGKIPVENWTELFRCFIAPFTQSGNKVEIEVKFQIHSSEASPLDENKQQYKSAKEAAKQLGMKMEEE